MGRTPAAGYSEDSASLGLAEQLLFFDAEASPQSKFPETKVGMTFAAESITESLRRTRQLMVQEVERSVNTLTTFGMLLHFLEESTGILKKAETEYEGNRPLLMRTRQLLTTMRHQDVIDTCIFSEMLLLSG